MSCQQSQPPDHLLRLVQLVRAHYIEIDVKGKAGRPRTYHGLSFLLLAVVAVTLRTFKGLELWRLLDQDSILRSELGFAAVPHRRTIERRLGALQAEAEAQVATLGQQIVEEIGPSEAVQAASAIDGRMYQARGPLWHQKQRKKGIIPLHLRNVDTESKWSKSGYRGSRARLPSDLTNLALACSNTFICHLAAEQFVRRACGSASFAIWPTAGHFVVVGRYQFRLARHGLSLRATWWLVVDAQAVAANLPNVEA